jgi:hypothetical protein
VKSTGAEASKQVLLRMANDRVYNLLWGFETHEGSFLCECSRPACSEEVAMSDSEYVRLRGRDERVYAPGHDGLGSRRRNVSRM